MSGRRQAASDDEEYVSEHEVDSDFSDTDSLGEIRSRGSDDEDDEATNSKPADVGHSKGSDIATDENEDLVPSDASADEEDQEGENEEDEAEDAEQLPPKRQLEPYEVPTSGAFYMHDNRFIDDSEDHPRRDVKSKKLWDPTEDKWLHDKFESLQFDDNQPASRTSFDRGGGRRGRGGRSGSDGFRGGRGRARGGRRNWNSYSATIEQEERNFDDDAPPGFENRQADLTQRSSTFGTQSTEDKPKILVVPRKNRGRGQNTAVEQPVNRENGTTQSSHPARGRAGRGTSAGRSSRGGGRGAGRGRGRSWIPKNAQLNSDGDARHSEVDENARPAGQSDSNVTTNNIRETDKSVTKTTLNADAKDYQPYSTPGAASSSSVAPAITTSGAPAFQPAMFPGYGAPADFHNWIPMTVPYAGMPPPIGTYLPSLGQAGVPFGAPLQPGIPVLPAAAAAAYPRPAIRPPAKRPIPIQPPPEKSEENGGSSSSNKAPENTNNDTTMAHSSTTSTNTVKAKPSKPAGRRYSALAGNLAT